MMQDPAGIAAAYLFAPRPSPLLSKQLRMQFALAGIRTRMGKAATVCPRRSMMQDPAGIAAAYLFALLAMLAISRPTHQRTLPQKMQSWHAPKLHRQAAGASHRCRVAARSLVQTPALPHPNDSPDYGH